MKRFWMFDLDGTLADTDGDIRLAWKAALADLGAKCERFDRDFVAGPPIEEMAKLLLPELYSVEFCQRLREAFGRHYDGDGFPTTREYPGVLARVRELKANGASVVILTNKRYVGAMAMARHFGWDRVFDAVYAGDMFAGDPSIGRLRKSELMRRVMRQHSVTADESVMVGDTKSDFEAAAENGVESVGVRWGYGKADELAMANRLVEHAEEI